MPAHKRLGAHNSEQVPPLDKPRERDEGNPRRVVSAVRSDLTFQVAGELHSQEQVLGRQLRARPEHQPYET